MRKSNIPTANTAKLKARWNDLALGGASEDFEGETARIERELDDREFRARHTASPW